MFGSVAPSEVGVVQPPPLTLAVRADTLRVTFDDTTTQVIDFSPILAGELYGPLRDVALFNQVQLGS